MIAKTTTRVEEHTAPRINDRIQEQTDRRLARYAHAPQGHVWDRLDQLEREWDMERALEANAAVATLIGVLLGRFVDRRLYAAPAMVAGFLLQHAVQGWCPPLPVLRRLGFRTAREIEIERRGLESLV